MDQFNVSVPNGHYVLAVSGGVDSMVLLNVMQQLPGVKLTVAHFDHGIRSDSAQDRRLVQEAAAFYGLPFVYQQGHLGAGASEDTARKARYTFLRQVQAASKAQAIITAHHQDDVLETAILNIMRGTGRRGLSSLQSKHDMLRPLLSVPKSQILGYAVARDLLWHEDSTNSDTAYKRNHVRQNVLPRLTEAERLKLISLIDRAGQINSDLDQALTYQLHVQPQRQTLERLWFVSLSHAVAREVMAAWLRAANLNGFDKFAIERLTIAAKTQAHGKRIDIMQGVSLLIGKDNLALDIRER